MADYLKRYTEIPYLLQLLQDKRITLLNPEKWDDRNDTSFMETYRRRKSLQSIVAFCLTDAPETYHHWRIFSSGSSGVCVEFQKSRLIKWASSVPRLLHGPVDYKTIEEIERRTPEIEKLPFLKRYPYRDEKEYRLVLPVRNEVVHCKSLEIDLSLIRRIVVNPWLPESVFIAVKAAICATQDCGSLVVSQTRILNSAKWQRLGCEIQRKIRSSARRRRSSE